MYIYRNIFVHRNNQCLMLPEFALGSHGDRNWYVSSAPGMLPRFLCLPSCVIHGVESHMQHSWRRFDYYSWGAPPCTIARSFFFLEINVSWNTVEHCQLSRWLEGKGSYCHIDPSLSLSLQHDLLRFSNTCYCQKWYLSQDCTCMYLSIMGPNITGT